MIISTTPKVAEGRITRTSGVVSGEAIIGAHAIRDLLAGISNIIGGRAGGYEAALREARDKSFGPDGGMLMVTAVGTAVKLGV